MTERRVTDRRRVNRGGRRGTDGPPPSLREGIDACARDIDAALSAIRSALESGNLHGARDGVKALQRATAGIRALLAAARVTTG